MASYHVAQRVGNIHAHKQNSGKQNVVLRLPQKGAGLGSLLRSFFKWIVPAGKNIVSSGKSILKSAAKSQLAKDTAEALKQEAATAGINLAQSALKGENIKESLAKQSKTAASNIGQSISKSLDQYKQPSTEEETNKKASKKRAGKTIPLRTKRMRFKKTDNLS